MYPILLGPPTTLRTAATYAFGCELAVSYLQLWLFQTSHGPVAEPTGIVLTTLPSFSPTPAELLPASATEAQNASAVRPTKTGIARRTRSIRSLLLAGMDSG